MNEVMIEEVLKGYDVHLRFTEYSAWTKDLTFIDKSDMSLWRARLHWDISDGYSLTWLGVPPKDLLGLSERPEFEYVVDCITEGDSVLN